jgi:hypothetical protein
MHGNMKIMLYRNIRLCTFKWKQLKTVHFGGSL